MTDVPSPSFAPGQSSAPPACSTDPGRAMTPEDMYTKLGAHIGFDRHIPAWKLEDTRAQLDRMAEELKTNPSKQQQQAYTALKNRFDISRPDGEGAQLRHGSQTSVLIQVVDKDGNLVEKAFGDYDKGGHAEQHAIKDLQRQLGDRKVPGGQVDVVGDREVCAAVCAPDLTAFAKKMDADRVHGHVFQRPRLDGKPGLAKEKRTMTTMTEASSEGMTPTRVSKVVYERAGSEAPPPPDEHPGPAIGAGLRAIGSSAALTSLGLAAQLGAGRR